MTFLCLIFKSGGVDCDTSCLFFRCFVDFAVFHVLSSGFIGEIFGDCGCESGFAVIDMTDGSDFCY